MLPLLEDPDLGPRIQVHGRCASLSKQWGEAWVLGTIFSLFFAPAFGFPLLSGGGSYLGFVGLIVILVICSSVIIKQIRKNRAIVRYERGLVVVDGPSHKVVKFEALQEVSYSKTLRKLAIIPKDGPELSIELPLGVGVAVVRGVKAQPYFSKSNPT